MILENTVVFFTRRCLVTPLKTLYPKLWYWQYHNIFGVLETKVRTKVFVSCAGFSPSRADLPPPPPAQLPSPAPSRLPASSLPSSRRNLSPPVSDTLPLRPHLVKRMASPSRVSPAPHHLRPACHPATSCAVSDLLPHRPSPRRQLRRGSHTFDSLATTCPRPTLVVEPHRVRPSPRIRIRAGSAGTSPLGAPAGGDARGRGATAARLGATRAARPLRRARLSSPAPRPSLLRGVAPPLFSLRSLAMPRCSPRPRRRPPHPEPRRALAAQLTPPSLSPSLRRASMRPWPCRAAPPRHRAVPPLAADSSVFVPVTPSSMSPAASDPISREHQTSLYPVIPWFW